VIAVRRDVGAGQTIVADDLKEVSISVDTSEPVAKTRF
jgi:hypothetical protein